jgi:hypothetical protein
MEHGSSTDYQHPVPVRVPLIRNAINLKLRATQRFVRRWNIARELCGFDDQ